MIGRRKFLIGAGTTAAALALYVFWPKTPVRTAGKAGETDAERKGFWIQVRDDGKVVFQSPSIEIGQGTHSGFAQIVSQYFDVPYGDVIVEDAPAVDGYGNPVSMNIHLTGGSTSIRGFLQPLTDAMLQARQLMINAAAQEWNTDSSKLTTKSGKVVNTDGTELAYSALIEAASKLPLPDKGLAFKGSDNPNGVGKSPKRLDLLGKITGQSKYTVDITVPDMVFGSFRYFPHFGQSEAKVANFDEVKAMPGITDIVTTSIGIVAIGKTTWHAQQACKAIKFDEASLPAELQNASDETIGELITEALDGEGIKEPEGAAVLNAEFSFPYLAHQTMEPQSCVASVNGDNVEVWTGSQAPGYAKDAAADAADVDSDNVQIHVISAGGGFGRRAESDMVIPTVEAAKAIGKPVKLIWSREQDTAGDFYRPMAKARVQISTGDDGKIKQWYQQYAVQSILSRYVAPIFDWIDYSPLALEGASALPYATDKLKTEVGIVEAHVPVGFWRSVAHTYTGFVVESSIDMLAHQAKQDPWQYRYDQVQEHPRHVRVLEKLKALSNWDAPAPAGRAKGIALVESFGSICAQVFEVSDNNGKPKVHDVYAVIDCGIAINPDVIKQQMEGAIIMGISAAMGEQINIVNGEVKQSNFHDYPILKMADAPESISVEIIAEGDEVGGIGEAGLPPAAPALANAWFALTSERRHQLPFSVKV